MSNLSEAPESIGSRLVAERRRLKIKQVALRAKLGIGKNAQINYEHGTTYPDAKYLAELYKLGFDVQYILTGTATKSAPIATAHQALIEAFDAAPRTLKTAAMAVLLSHVIREQIPETVCTTPTNH